MIFFMFFFENIKKEEKIKKEELSRKQQYAQKILQDIEDRKKREVTLKKTNK